MKDRLTVILVIAIPACAVLMGAISLFLAMQGPNQEILVDDAPLTKTSWRESRDADDH